ncbi:hypothetical protein [Streptomyces sp. NBU3104]|nr:hypothetical protein [Streptomyces sp. NBU3104]UKL04226.1 hypothetical protein L2I08_15550 [Streptomyces sp. NBU3104]
MSPLQLTAARGPLLIGLARGGAEGDVTAETCSLLGDAWQSVVEGLLR